MWGKSAQRRHSCNKRSKRNWIGQLLRVVAARNRYAKPGDRERVESLFRRAQDEYRRRAK